MCDVKELCYIAVGNDAASSDAEGFTASMRYAKLRFDRQNKQGSHEFFIDSWTLAHRHHVGDARINLARHKPCA